MSYRCQVARRATDHYIPDRGNDQHNTSKVGTIAWCIDQLPSYGGAIELGRDLYWSDNEIVVNKPVVIFGCGKESLVKRSVGSSGNGLFRVESSDCVLKDFDVGYNQTYVGTDPLIYNPVGGDDNTYENIGFRYHEAATGIYVSGDGATIDRCHWAYKNVYSPALNSHHTSIRVSGDGCKIKDNMLESHKIRGMLIEGSNNIVTGNLLTTGDISSYIGSIIIEAGANDNEIVNNSLVVTSDTPAPLAWILGDNNLFADNRCTGTGTTASHQRGVAVNGDYNFITGNTFHQCYGWYLFYTGADYNKIYQNNFPICGGGQLDNGTGNVFHNPASFY
jgi:hypothetical protein